MRLCRFPWQLMSQPDFSPLYNWKASLSPVSKDCCHVLPAIHYPWMRVSPGSLLLWTCCCSVAQSCPTLCDPMDCSTPGFPDLHHLLELAQTHVHWVGDAFQTSRPLLSPSPPGSKDCCHVLPVTRSPGMSVAPGSFLLWVCKNPLTIKPLMSLSLTPISFFSLEAGQVQGLQASGVQPNTSELAHRVGYSVIWEKGKKACYSKIFLSLN